MNTLTAPAVPAMRSLRAPSLIAGLALVLMGVLAAFGNFGVVGALVTPGDAERTTADIAAAETLFRSGTAALLLVVILDLVVAAALYAVFRPVSQAVAAAAAWCRVAYAAAFAAAIGQLALVPDRLDRPEAVLEATEAFTAMWSVALGVFGCHLVILGWLAWRARFLHAVFGVLLAIAGLGYLVDTFAVLLGLDLGVGAATFTFVGELALMAWLLLRGPKVAVPLQS